MAKEKQPEPFEIQTNGHQLSLMSGVVVANMFRKNMEVDHLMIDLSQFPDEYPEGNEQVLRVFNNEDLVRWMAGIAFKETFRGHFKPEFPEYGGKSFRERTGWNPAVVIREEPTEQEKQWYAEVITKTMDEEWSDWDE